MSLLTPTPRTVSRVVTSQAMGPDAQVDDRSVAFAPTDPARTDPFLLLSEDWFSAPGFQWHPHRGIETVTTVVDGILEHGDSLGNRGALEVGDVQWMTAGRGIVHRELAYRDEHAHTLQLWLNLPAEHKMTEHRYQDVPAAGRPRIRRPGAVLEIISGTVDEVTGPAATRWPVTGVMATLEPGASTVLDLPTVDRAFVHVLTGTAVVAGRATPAGSTAWSEPLPAAANSGIHLSNDDPERPTHVMIYSGRPIREDVVFGGPFVMNTRAEIEQAYSDLRRGAFGAVPAAARARYLR